ncbi:DICT sensory domain-containing protein [Nocardioides sp. MAHUQ-72]|uniref:DICT sensory domain-containing protein n=1 Tax=unclassified Nocardioides TaxID=2615069 RepID=UPI00361840DC
MTTAPTPAQGVDGDSALTIGDLSRRTGVSPATLRMWESRHGFPVPARLESGHRRYDEGHVAAVDHVVRRRDAGVRLDVAIAEAMAAAEPATPSVFAELRRRHPQLAAHRLRKSTLLALSWAIEDEFCARAERAHLFGGFQRERYFRPARDRWAELSRVAASTTVFADFPDGSDASALPRLETVALGPDEPMRREWFVVCESRDLPVALTAWELPGQGDVPDRERIFESLWTVEAGAVRDAARVCARVAQEHGVAAASPLLYELADEPAAGFADLTTVSTLFNRVIAYVDRFGS